MSAAAALLLAAVAAGPVPAPPPDLAAVGVVVSTAAGRSVAILESGGRTRAVGVGGRAFGGRVTAVTRRLVTLDFGGRTLELKLTGGTTAAAPAAAAGPSPDEGPPPGEAMGAGGPARRVLDRAQLDRRLAAEMNRLIQAALRPVRQDGRVIGMRVSQIPEGTILQDVGLRSGDVLTDVNGMKVDGLPALFDLWKALPGASEIDATVLRDGVIVGLGVSLR